MGKPGAEGPTVPIRVCDQAADAISRHRKDLPFEMEKPVANLDRQIGAMRKALGFTQESRH